MSQGTADQPAAVTDPRLLAVSDLARAFGADPAYARGGGGNASAKVDGILFIKPSGIRLADITPDVLIPLDMAPLLELLDAPDDGDNGGSDIVMRTAAGARRGHVGGRRPSVELLFHTLLPETLVVHLHPTVHNAVVCNDDGAALVDRLFGDRAVWVSYADPGLPLARAIRTARSAHQARTGGAAPRLMFLENHGIVVSGETAVEIEETVAWSERTIRDAMTPGSSAVTRLPASRAGLAGSLVHAIGPALRAMLATGSVLPVVTFDDADIAASLAMTREGRVALSGGPLTPDQIVYAGSWPLILDIPEGMTDDEIPAHALSRLDAHRTRTGESPIVTVVPGLGLFASGDTWEQADTARHVYLDALRVSDGAMRLGSVRAMSEAARVFIERWEAEAYRRSVAGTTPAGRVAGRVAVVTGAAQGFGLAIAADLVAEGAHVALADLNIVRAREQADALEERFGPGRATAVAVDVTDDASVTEAIHAVVRRYGGLDLLVSNAGVLRAGGVTSQPVDEFDLVTQVNYRGYFLCVRAAAPVMARQHAARPDWWGDIVEINSKSGLVGSSRNSAYAGSKFGGIGLTQSFALELVGEGIKVNAICPGNYLDGPLWSDPIDGLFVQYLREGKVPAAESVDDVRRFYEAKVPMGRGCTPADVLEALYYVIAQRYETGQALPVTGGQVMLA